LKENKNMNFPVKLSALAVLALASIPAQATLMVNVGGSIVGGALVGGVTYFDNQPGVDSNAALGILDLGPFLDTVATNFRINGFTALSAEPVASLASTANVNVRQTTVVPFSVDVFITDTGFLLPAVPLKLNQTVNLLSSVGGVTVNATSTGWYGDSNTEFDVDGSMTSAAKAGVKNGIALNSAGVSGLIVGPVPYSLTTHIKLDVLARGTDPIQNLQINSNLSAQGGQIPEPSTSLLFGCALLGLGALVRLRK